jgi:hypothetical protein
MRIDTYTKIVLSLIALALWAILLQPYLETEQAGASSGVLDVNLVKIDGRNIDSVLDVNIQKVNGRTIYDEYLPVEIKKWGYLGVYSS